MATRLALIVMTWLAIPLLTSAAYDYENGPDLSIFFRHESGVSDSIAPPKHTFAITDPPRYIIKAPGFNSPGMDFSPCEFNDGIVFVSSLSRKGTIQGDEEMFLNLFFVSEHADGSFSQPKPLNAANVSAYHEGPVTFYEDGKKMIFTRNTAVRKSKRHDGSVSPLELAQSEFLPNGKWSEPITISFAGQEHSVGHPSVNKHGTTLYFSSNMPGTLGQSDLFVTHFRDGEWTSPANLGAAINTTGQELFPFVYEDSLLFFASNGHGGVGGLDIFYYNLRGSDQSIYSMEAPVNSTADDFGIYVEPGLASGFFSSNRDGGKGEDDIYYFEEVQRFVQIQLYDSVTRTYVHEATLKLKEGLHTRQEIRPDLAGKAEFRLSPGRRYWLSILAPGYESKLIEVKGSLADQTAPLKLYLRPISQFKNGQVFSGIQTRERSGLTNVISFSSSPLDVDVVSESAGTPKEESFSEIPDSLSSTRLKVIAVEVINDLPALFIIRNDSIYELKHSVGAFLENKALGLEIEIPYGAKRHVYEEIIRKQVEAQGHDIGRFLLIRSFFFDSGKTWVRNDACAQLDKIIEVMGAYPHVSLQMIFHADSRGTEKFNLELSEARAVEVSGYLTNAGIKPERIMAKFVGEGQLLNDCGDLADCDELLHQTNRTVEFKFIIR